ncbi:MAG: hypothetical protein AAF828_02575 [Bacteroidota bacterium]
MKYYNTLILALAYVFILTLFPISSSLVAQSVGRSADTLGNPFDFSSLNLPYTSPCFGSGWPRRLLDRDVREVVKRVFIEEGLQWKTTHIWQEGEDQVKLDAYDPTTKIGFVYLHHSQLGLGATWGQCSRAKIRNVTTGEGDWLTKELEKLITQDKSQDWFEAKIIELKHSSRFDATKKKRYIRLVTKLRNGKKVPSIQLENFLIDTKARGRNAAYVEAILAQVTELKKGKQRSELIRQFNLLHGQWQTRKRRRSPLQEQLQQLAFELAKEPYHSPGNPQKWANIHMAVDVLNRCKYVEAVPVTQALSKAIKAARTNDWSELQRVKQWRNIVMADLSEIKKMIAVQSITDDRVLVMNDRSTVNEIERDPAFVYYGRAPEYVFAGLPPKEKIESLPEAEKMEVLTAYRTRAQEYRNNERGINRQRQLETLAQQVRSFINWARTSQP